MRAVHVIGLGEGMIAQGLAEVQKHYPDIDLGSYPFYREGGNGVALVAKGTLDAGTAARARATRTIWWGVALAVAASVVTAAALNLLVISTAGRARETLEGLKDAEGKSLVGGIFAAVPYCIDLIGGPYLETRDDVVKAFRPKSAIRPPRS